VIEMGPRVQRRSKDLMAFWKHNVLTPNSNGVFGEGGAGAFSDGKLTTRTSSPYHRFVHETLIKYGAKPNVLHESRAHVGTDKLRKIIARFSKDIEDSGATFLYNTSVQAFQLNHSSGAVEAVKVRTMPLRTDQERAEQSLAYANLRECGLTIDTAGKLAGTDGPAAAADTQLRSVTSPNKFGECEHHQRTHLNGTNPNCCTSLGGQEQRGETGSSKDTAAEISEGEQGRGGAAPLEFWINASDVFVATGHSSRGVIEELYSAGVAMCAKPYAVGLRLQIQQKYINLHHFGSAVPDKQLGGPHQPASERASERASKRESERASERERERETERERERERERDEKLQPTTSDGQQRRDNQQQTPDKHQQQPNSNSHKTTKKHNQAKRKRNSTKPNQTKQNKTKPNQTKQNKTKQNKTKEEEWIQSNKKIQYIY